MNSLSVRKSDSRGLADLGWLVSKHTFSFGEYYDPAHMGFRSLRVINQDRVAPGRGFSTHPHRDMEIFSYVVEGALEHRDSLGNGRQLTPGQIQLMSAGSGITHSEFNPSQSADLHFLQIWIKPREKNLPPRYTEWHPVPESEKQVKVLVISPDGRDGSAIIAQDASVYRIRIPAGERFTHQLAEGRGLWLQLISGELESASLKLEAGDAASTEQPGNYEFVAGKDAEGLLFDLGDPG